ncbi:hypothetical protein ACTXT7_014860 [Hymenolepis weldensis]
MTDIKRRILIDVTKTNLSYLAILPLTPLLDRCLVTALILTIITMQTKIVSDDEDEYSVQPALYLQEDNLYKLAESAYNVREWFEIQEPINIFNPIAEDSIGLEHILHSCQVYKNQMFISKDGQPKNPLILLLHLLPQFLPLTLIEPSASVEIPEPVASEDIILSVSEKLSPAEYGQKLLPLQQHFNYLKLVVKHDEDLYDFAGIVNLHCDRLKVLVTTKNSSVKTNGGKPKRDAARNAPIDSDAKLTRLEYKSAHLYATESFCRNGLHLVNAAEVSIPPKMSSQASSS